MEYIYNIALVFGAVFAVGMTLTALLWIRFFPVVKKIDSKLYEEIRFRWKFTLKTPYADFIFNKKYEASRNSTIKNYSRALYHIGNVSQWSFNIYMILMAGFIVISWASL